MALFNYIEFTPLYRLYRISREKPTNVAKCDELVGLFRRNYDENRGEKRKLPTKFMIYAKIVGFLTDKKCLIL